MTQLNDKMKALKKYCDVQANDGALWFDTQNIVERYLQQELRRITAMIEDGDENDILDEIELLRGRVG